MMSARAVLPAVVAAVVARQPLSPAALAFVWRAAVGPAIDRATSVSLADGTLEVHASSRGWREEIARSAPVILPRLQAILGPDVVKTIKLA